MPDSHETGADERVQFRVPAGTFVPSQTGAELPVDVQPEPSALPTTGVVPAFSLGRAKAHLAVFTRLAAADLEEEWSRGTAFLLIPVCLGIGAITYFSLTMEPDVSAILLGIGALVVLLFLARNRMNLQLGLAMLLITVSGMAAAKLETWRAGTTMLGSAVTTRVTGTIARVEQQAGGRIRLTLDVVGTERPKLRYQPQRIRVTTTGLPTSSRPGMTITGLARLLPPRGPLTVGGYDFSFESYFDRIGANGFFLGQPELAQQPAILPLRGRLAAVIETVRLNIHDRITKVLPGEKGEIASALITGMKRGIGDETTEALRRTGLAHILSISGLHMALAAGTVMGMLRALFALFPDFSSRHPVRKYAAGAALLAVFAYLFLSGAGVATQRSFTMLAVMLIALTFDRAAITMRNLAIAGIIMLVIVPHEIMGPSFQMSFAATAALIAAYAVWSERRANRPPPALAGPLVAGVRTAIHYVTALAVTSIVAGLATMVFAAFHFHRIAPLGLPANLAAMPLVSVLVMPPAVVAVMLMPFDLDGPALAVMGQGISLVTGIAHWFAERTSGDVIGLLPVQAVAMIAAGLVVAAVASTRWRLAALPFVLAGALLIAKREMPDLLISEDARLVAFANTDGSVAVNTERPNRFVIDDWQRSMQQAQILSPLASDPLEGSSANVARFTCADGLCTMRSRSGVTVAHVSDRSQLSKACAQAAIVILADATLKDPCRRTQTRPIVITAKNLAQRGTASVVIGENGLMQAAAEHSTGSNPPEGQLLPEITVTYAVPSMERPWHAHRAFSRAARGLAERKPRRSVKTQR